MNVPRLQNVLRGRKNQAAGDLFETWIDIQHQQALRLGILVAVEHHEPHAKMIQGKLFYVRPGVSDYAGVFAGGGAFAVEAKSTEKERLPRSAVKPAQARYLDAVSGAGEKAVALLLVEFRHGGKVPRRYAIPWREVPWKVLRSAESLGEEDVAKWEIRPGECYVANVKRR